jgi:hypothetical protein
MQFQCEQDPTSDWASSPEFLGIFSYLIFVEQIRAQLAEKAAKERAKLEEKEKAKEEEKLRYNLTLRKKNAKKEEKVAKETAKQAQRASALLNTPSEPTLNTSSGLQRHRLIFREHDQLTVQKKGFERLQE